jgi:hypothetical protein
LSYLPANGANERESEAHNWAKELVKESF